MAPVFETFANSPLFVRNLSFTPRQKVTVQLLVTFFFVAAFVAAHRNFNTLIDATPWSKNTLPDESEIDAWILLLFPLFAIIPMIYVFMFLKYNFLK